MTSRKYIAVLQTEKAMNDAIFSVLANLHKAARRKSDHIWSPYKFDSLKYIWEDDANSKTNKIDSKANNNGRHAKSSLSEKDNDLNIKANGVKLQEHYHEKDTEELSFKVDCKVPPDDKSGQDVLRRCQNIDNSLHGYGFETYHQDQSNFKTPSAQKGLESGSISINDGQNQLELGNSIFRRPVQYGAPDKLSFSKQKSLPNEKNVVESMTCEEFKDTKTKHVDSYLDNNLPQNIFATTQASYPDKDNTSSDDYDHEIMNKLLPVSKIRRMQKLSKQFNTSLVEQNTLRSKRNRDESDSSTGSNKHLHKKTSGKIEDVNQNSKDKEDNFFKALLSVKIMKDDHFYEITINSSEFDRIKNKYPQLIEIFPDTDSSEKEIPYCAEAVKIIIGYLFHPPFDFNSMPDGRTSVEILAATKAWAIQRFHDNFQQNFMKRITKGNCRTIYSLARHFDLHQICSACKIFFTDGEELASLSDRRTYKSRKCCIAVSHYVEPLEFCIPLGSAEHLLNDNFDRDIRNTVIFEAITKDFYVAGFQITLDASDGTTNETSAALDIFYSIKSTNSPTDPEEVKLSRPFRPNIVIHFKRKVVLKKSEKIQISVETTIKPYLCFETYESFLKTSDDAEFSLTVESTYRVKNSGGKRFIIGKLLYNPIDEV